MRDQILVYDDDCGFCTWWADLFDRRTDLTVVGFSDLDAHEGLRERLPADYDSCSHLVTDDTVYSCGASIEQALLRTEPGELLVPLVTFLRTFDDYDRFRERAYRRVADNRDAWGKIVSKTPPARRDG